MRDKESMLVHDLKTPLTGIKGYTDLLTEEILGPLNDEQHQALQSVRGCYEMALSIIDDILYLVTMEQGEAEPAFRQVDMAELVNRAAEIHRGTMKEKRIRLKLPTKSGAICFGDEGQILRVLTNLLTNAIRYTPAGGMIEISIRRKKNVLHISEAVVVAVTDTGIGIPPEMHERIFEKFRQADTDFTRQGNGLGLAICREIVTRHGGDIWVESPVYGTCGSRFCFAFPTVERTDALPKKKGSFMIPAPEPVHPEVSLR